MQGIIKMTLKQKIYDEFGSFAHASRKLDIDRQTIRSACTHGKFSTYAIRRIRKAGYCPDTFKPVAHVKD